MDEIKNKRNTSIIAICGVKNSGKTTLITKLVERLIKKDYKVATIKHDGHDFEPDVYGTDTYKHRSAGAFGTAIISKNKFMVIKNQQDTDENELINLFPEADLIILEGFKNSSYPKFEIIREGNSINPVSNKENLIAILSDIKNIELTKDYDDIEIVDLNDIESIENKIVKYINK